MKLGKVTAILLVLLSAIVMFSGSESGVMAKVATCRTRFKKGKTFDYCTKFGTAAH